MSERLLLGGFSNMQLVDFHYHVDPDSWESSYIELVAEGQGKRRHLRFEAPRNLHIEEGFSGSLSGMEILDISDRQWGSTRVKVSNFEQDPGITFLAASMEIVSGT